MASRRLFLPAALLVLLSTAAPLLAQPARSARPSRGFELGFDFTQNVFDDDALTDDELGFAGRFGYLVTPEHEFEFMINGVSTEDALFPGDHVDVVNWQVAYLYNFTRSGIVPYVTAGIGLLTADSDFFGTETDGVIGFGGGVRLFLAHAFFVRFEARQNLFTGDGRYFTDEEDLSMFQASFGLGWRFPLYP